MQCPSCGFENLPGRESCVVCSASLSARKPGERVMPVRAKDRSLWEHFSWGVKRGRLWMDSVRMVRTGTSWFTKVLFTILSAIPGFGHAIVLGDLRTGLYMFFGSALLLGGAVLLYRKPVSNLFGYITLLLSMYSVWSASIRLYGVREDPARRLLAGFSTLLFVISGYAGLYFAAIAVASYNHRLVTYMGWSGRGMVESGDMLFLSRHHEYSRGDLVVGYANYGDMSIGPVLGVPGDRVYLSDKVYVNGRPTQFSVARMPEQGGQPALVELGRDEYWIIPLTVVQYGNVEYAANGFKINGEDIWGRAEAVIGPPAHRRRMNSVKTGD